MKKGLPAVKHITTTHAGSPKPGIIKKKTVQISPKGRKGHRG